jgi:hypothetical protein
LSIEVSPTLPGFFSKLSNIGLQSLSGLLTLINSREKYLAAKSYAKEQTSDVTGSIANPGLICNFDVWRIPERWKFPGAP